MHRYIATGRILAVLTILVGLVHEVYITKTALFDKLFLCRPPRFIFSVGKS